MFYHMCTIETSYCIAVIVLIIIIIIITITVSLSIIFVMDETLLGVGEGYRTQRSLLEYRKLG